MSSNEAYDCFVARAVVVSPRLLVPKAPETESREFRETSIRGAGVGRADPRVEGGATRVRDAATGAARQANAMTSARGSASCAAGERLCGADAIGHSRKARENHRGSPKLTRLRNEVTTAFVARSLDASSDGRSRSGRSRVVPAAVQPVLLVEHRVDELAQRVVRRGCCSKETASGGGGETVSHETFRLFFGSFFVSNEGGRVASAGRRSDVTLANVELELVRRDDEPPRKDAALLHLPPTSKPNMSNSPCVATSTRLLRSFAGGRALRGARCGAASAAALEGAGRASALGMASARTIAASMPMRRSRRNIEEGGSPVVQSVVGGWCFKTL